MSNAYFLRSGDFCAYDNNKDDKTDYFTPCACARGKNLTHYREKMQRKQVKVVMRRERVRKGGRREPRRQQLLKKMNREEGKRRSHH